MDQMKRTVIACVLALAAAAPAASAQSGHSLSIAASPQNVAFGKPVAIFGQLTGPGSAGERVDLQANPFGGNNAFSTVGSGTTDAAGNYVFAVAPAGNTIYRARARTSPRTDSFEFIVGVIPRVSLGVSDSTPSSGHTVTFYGAVRPPHDGALLELQRLVSGRWRTVRTVALVTAPNGRSVWSKKLKVNHSGSYRAILPAHLDHKTGKSRSRTLHAH
jgi:hypothetical protein